MNQASFLEQLTRGSRIDSTADDAVLITGSLYVVGAARPHLRTVLP